MGCRITKPEVLVVGGDPASGANENAIMPSSDSRLAEKHKARLERQMCLARETPEPEFLLSECDLKAVPSGVFILCRVLRKELLDVRRNRLRSLDAGGALGDLALLTVLDLRENCFRTLPEDVNQLVNLQKLFVSHNQLERLPRSINQLRHLELLDISHNRLRGITEINCMTKLHTLDISSNSGLSELPTELSTCSALVRITCTAETIREPPRTVTDRGTRAIMTYLAGDVMTALEIDDNTLCSTPISDVETPKRQFDENNVAGLENQTRDEQLAFDVAENQLQLQQQQRREQLLNNLLQQQTESDAIISKVQLNRDLERSKLIKDIVKAEESSTFAVDQLLSLRTEPDLFLMEREQHDREVVLGLLHIKHSELRKTEVLAAMSSTLALERQHIDAYQVHRENMTRDIMQAECVSHERLDRAVWDKDRGRSHVVDRILHDEQLQRTAVGSLIEQNDARSWALMEQVRLVETQLRQMTRIELTRKQHNLDSQLTELSEKRMNLTCTLQDLLEQQDRRKKQLLDTLHHLESQKRSEEDFWLLQYQKLIDSRPASGDDSSGQLDPQLGYQLLVHGAIHCLPFLAKMLQSKKCAELSDVTDDALENCGVKSEADRRAISKAILEYTRFMGEPEKCRECCEEWATADGADARSAEANAIMGNSSSASPPSDDGEMMAECVVCMESSCKIIFLPCGHLCCCLDCHESLVNCPMCRSVIDRRIKVIQV